MASEDWREFGKRSIPTLQPFTIKLGQLDELDRQKEEKMEQFRELTGDAYKEAEAAKVAALAPDLRKVWEKDPEERTEAGKDLMKYLVVQVTPDLQEVVKNADPSVRLRAVTLVEEMRDLAERRLRTNGYRTQINYPYWDTLAQAEQEARTVEARKLVYDAEQANAEAELDKAISLYEQAFATWKEIFEDYPVLVIDDTADNLYDSIIRYMNLIDTDTLPEDFPLLSFAQMMSNGSASPEAYATYREEQESRAEARRKELEAEERQREAEAAEKSKDDATDEDDPKGDENPNSKEEMSQEEPQEDSDDSDESATDEDSKTDKAESEADQGEATEKKKSDEPNADVSNSSTNDEQASGDEEPMKEKAEPKEKAETNDDAETGDGSDKEDAAKEPQAE
jgi:hypothetical protein